MYYDDMYKARKGRIRRFSRRKKMTDMKRLTISLTKDVYEKLVEDAKKLGLNKSSYITVLIKNLKKQE